LAVVFVFIQPQENVVNSTSSVALSGMQAAQTQLRSSAHNVANLATDNFRRQEVRQSPQSSGGVQARVERATAAGLDPVKDVVDQLQAKNAFLANLSIFKANDKMAGALLDEKA
jgi:flagellar hook-associated protein FlgK